MNKLVTFCLMMIMSVSVFAQKDSKQYNKTLADSLGADKYGMKMYQFVTLKTGPNQITDKDSVNMLFGGHMQNIKAHVATGQLLVAGPFGKNDNDMRGLFILNVKDENEAQAILDKDPAIKAGLLKAEIVPWYGSAALAMYLRYQDQIQMESH